MTPFQQFKRPVAPLCDLERANCSTAGGCDYVWSNRKNRPLAGSDQPSNPVKLFAQAPGKKREGNGEAHKVYRHQDLPAHQHPSEGETKRKVAAVQLAERCITCERKPVTIVQKEQQQCVYDCIDRYHPRDEAKLWGRHYNKAESKEKLCRIKAPANIITNKISQRCGCVYKKL